MRKATLINPTPGAASSAAMQTLLASVVSQPTHSTKEIIMTPLVTISHQEALTLQSKPQTQGLLTKQRSIRAFKHCPNIMHRASMTQAVSEPRWEVNSTPRIVTIR